MKDSEQSEGKLDENIHTKVNIWSKLTNRHDVIAWVCGLLFIFLAMLAVMLIGKSVNWEAPSTFVHYNTSSVTRFSPEPEYCNQTDVKGRNGDSCGGRWYYWKLPVDRVTSLTRGIAWLCYSSHQMLFWVIIYIAQMEKSNNVQQGPKFGTKLNWYNWVLLSGNAAFILIHLGQTHWTYDGLAQDVTMASSQGSVILMIALIMALEYKERGIIFMWPNSTSDDPVGRRTRLNQEPINAFRKYHGYLICWAMTYTFWYHPMENTWGHVLGFIHAGMIFLQGSLIYTRFHMNGYWKLVNESWVMFHGSLVAVQTRSSASRQQWPMYFLGFGFLLFFTQIFGLRFWRKIHFGFRAIPPVLFVIVAMIMCGTGVIRSHTVDGSNFSRLSELFFIPLQLFIQVFLLWLLVYVMIQLENWIHKKQDDTSTNENQVSDVSVISNTTSDHQHVPSSSTTKFHEMSRNVNSTDKEEPNTEAIKTDLSTSNSKSPPRLKQVLGITGFLFINIVMILVSFLIQWTDVSLSLNSLMFILAAVFTFFWSIAIFLTKIAFSTS